MIQIKSRYLKSILQSRSSLLPSYCRKKNVSLIHCLYIWNLPPPLVMLFLYCCVKISLVKAEAEVDTKADTEVDAALNVVVDRGECSRGY